MPSRKVREALEVARRLEKEEIPSQDEISRQYKADLAKEIALAKLLKDDWYLHGSAKKPTKRPEPPKRHKKISRRQKRR